MSIRAAVTVVAYVKVTCDKWVVIGNGGWIERKLLLGFACQLFYHELVRPSLNYC
jgi:hypothetical protein